LIHCGDGVGIPEPIGDGHYKNSLIYYPIQNCITEGFRPSVITDGINLQ